MASSPSSNPQPTPGGMGTGVAILIIVVLCIVVVGISFLPEPYHTIGTAIIYAGLVAAVAGKLRTCFRLAHGSEFTSKLYVVSIWLVLGVFLTATSLLDLFRTESRDYIRLAPIMAISLALLYALELAEQSLKRKVADNSAEDDRQSETPSNPSLPPGPA